MKSLACIFWRKQWFYVEERHHQKWKLFLRLYFEISSPPLQMDVSKSFMLLHWMQKWYTSPLSRRQDKLPTNLLLCLHLWNDMALHLFQQYYDLDTELTYSCFPGYKQTDGFAGAQCFFFNGTARYDLGNIHAMTNRGLEIWTCALPKTIRAGFVNPDKHLLIQMVRARPDVPAYRLRPARGDSQRGDQRRLHHLQMPSKSSNRCIVEIFPADSCEFQLFMRAVMIYSRLDDPSNAYCFTTKP